jgi:hypothetical protein
MRHKTFMFAVIGALAILTPALTLAAAPCDCCTDSSHSTAKACCTDNACKNDAVCCDQANEMAAQVLLPQPAPVRQAGVVWFRNPVRVGDHILMGKYIIEHDTQRMARGLPCTHIYAVDKPNVPVVTFHCVHLDGQHTDKDVATVQPTGDPTIAKLASFQFAGETAVHGVPRLR